MCCDLIHDRSVLRQHLLCFLITVFQDLHHFIINCRCCYIGAVHGSSPVQILAFRCCQPHQSKTLAHTILGHHGSCNIGCPFNIIGSTCCNGVEYNFFCRTAAKKPDDHIMQLCFGIQIFFFFRNLHDVAKRTHGARNDRDLLYRLCVFLQCCDQGVSYLVVRNDPSLFPAHDTVFLFFSDQHHLDCIKQILLADSLTAVLDCIDRCFVDHIGEIGTDRSRSCKCDLLQIYGFIHADVFGMYLQNVNTAFQIRFIHNNTSVKPARSEQCLIQNFRSVCRTQDQNTLGAVKTIHFGKQLVQCLFTFLITAAVFAVTAPADRIYFIDKNNTWRIFRCFPK